MASCLGLYIEENLIKYAKVSKEQDSLKIDSFGVKFSDKIEESIKQIVEETYSFKLPIYVNLSKEQYKYFTMFSLLNKTDLKKAIRTEFESYCYDKGFNANALESRYALTNKIKEKDKLKTIFVYVNKVEMNRIAQQFQEKNLEGIIPLPICIANLAEVKQKENTIILSLEKETTITVILNGNIYEIKKLETSMGDMLDEINTKENSYSKAYEICKNTTIYTSESRELQENQNEHLETIIMNLYKILDEVKSILEETGEQFEKMYISGTGALINNVDLYFQEYFKNMECEILRPYFINENIKLNMKDYIEVDSAIALAMQGLGYGIKEMNFKKSSLSQKIENEINASLAQLKSKKIFESFSKKNHIEGEKKEKATKGKTIKVSQMFNGVFTINNEKTSKALRMLIINLICFNIIYSAYSINIRKQLDAKKSELDVNKNNIETKIKSITESTSEIRKKTTEYTEQKEELEKINIEYTEKMGRKNAISTLLSEIMYCVPKEVLITSIENTNGKHVTINAEAEKYEYLGYLKAKIKSDGILNSETVISSSGVKQDNVIKVTIEGDLP